MFVSGNTGLVVVVVVVVVVEVVVVVVGVTVGVAVVIISTVYPHMMIIILSYDDPHFVKKAYMLYLYRTQVRV